MKKSTIRSIIRKLVAIAIFIPGAYLWDASMNGTQPAFLAFYGLSFVIAAGMMLGGIYLFAQKIIDKVLDKFFETLPLGWK